MGVNHAASGAAVWLAATAALPLAGTDLYPLAPMGVLAGAVVCAGAALLPDADHHSATIAHSVPVLGPLATGLVEEESGGHRHGAHTLLAGVVVTVIAFFVGRIAVALPAVGPIALGTVPLGAAIATVPLICFAVKARGMVGSWGAAWLAGLAAGIVVLVFSPDTARWFAIAVGAGFVTHIAGDLLTVEGVPGPLWPVMPKPPRSVRRSPLKALWHGNGYVSVPVLGHAGSIRERILGVALLLYVVYGAGTVALRAAQAAFPSLPR